MVLSQRIYLLLEQMLEEANGTLSIGRNELAEKMGCVPSQINYVITSRFTPERGYIVESRRGGGGFIRIRKIAMAENEYLMHFYRAVGDRIDYDTAKVFALHLVGEGILTEREAQILLAPLTEQALSGISKEKREALRAELFKNTILRIASL